MIGNSQDTKKPKDDPSKSSVSADLIMTEFSIESTPIVIKEAFFPSVTTR